MDQRINIGLIPGDWKRLRVEGRARGQENLARVMEAGGVPDGFRVLGPGHWVGEIIGARLDYYPTKGKWMWRRKWYFGDRRQLAHFIGDGMAASESG